MSADVCVPESDKRPVDHHVVAALLFHQGRLGLFRRSSLVTGDIGLWHCITGYLTEPTTPLAQVFAEIQEEVGIGSEHLRLGATARLDLEGADGLIWRIHAFHFNSRVDTLRLNWENDAGRWVPIEQLAQYSTVSWLQTIIQALAPLGSPSLSSRRTRAAPLKKTYAE